MEKKISVDTIERIQQLREKGCSLREIGCSLSVSTASVRYYTEPTFKQHMIERVREWKRKKQQGNHGVGSVAKARCISEYEKGYLAGMIDGEGCLGMYFQKNGTGYQYWNITLIISNNSYETLWEIRNIVGEGNIWRSGWRRPRAWRYQVSGKTLEWLLPKLKLITKRRHSELIIEALELQQIRLGRDVSRLHEIAQEIRGLNKR